jgi:predicted secreted protein
MLTALLVAVSLVPAAPATKVLKQADSGKTVTIAAKQRLEVELSECGTCGYRWRTTIKPAASVLKRRPQAHKDPTCPPSDDPSQPQCVGGSDTTVFRYTGRAAGRTKLRLEYFGPGQKQSSKTFRVTVRVR